MSTRRETDVNTGGLGPGKSSLHQSLFFRHGWVLTILFLAMNGILLFNALFHDPRYGYDAFFHLQYLEVLAELRLPTPEDTLEFFPPLPYLPAALAMAGLPISLATAAKFTQFVNVIVSLGLIAYMLKICNLLLPGNRYVTHIALLLLAMLPVYYKTFAFVRGEPMTAFFTTALVYYGLLLFASDRHTTWKTAVGLGLVMGCGILSRQWAGLAFPGLFLFALVMSRGEMKRVFRFGKILTTATLVCIIVGGWFYLNLRVQQGSADAFNRSPEKGFSLANQPRYFYFGLGSGKLFTLPGRPHFANQLIPIFYSEIWGDYWQFFSVFGRDMEREGTLLERSAMRSIDLLTRERVGRYESNAYRVVPYLGRANYFGLLPTFLLIGAFLFALSRFLTGIFSSSPWKDEVRGGGLLCLVVTTSLLGYFWFLVQYPNPGKGDTIKATYMLQVFPLLAILGGIFMDWIRERSFYLFSLVTVLLAAAGLHSLPAMFTRFIT